MVRQQIPVRGMTCANCVRHVQEALEELPELASVQVNLATEQATFEVDQPVSSRKLARALRSAGYDLGEQEGNPWTKYLIGGIATALPMILYMMVYLPLGGAPWSGAGWAMFVLASIAQGFVALPFYKGTLRALRARDATMDTLVALGSTAAYLLSLYQFFLGHGLHATYFETSASILAFISLGKWLETRAKAQASAAVRALMDLAPSTARVERDGEWVEIPAAELAVGDRIQIRPGDRVAADGIVQSGRADADESMLNGESVPLAKEAGSPLRAGTIVAGGTLVAEVTAVGDETTIGAMIRFVAEAQSRKAPLQALADRVSRVFVPTILILAGLTYLFWQVFGAQQFGIGQADSITTFSILMGVSVLVIACPCAMGLATPAAVMVGTGAAAKSGILIRGGESLERLAHLDGVVLDKTGTLTQGHPSLESTEAADGFQVEELIAWAAAAEAPSEHPYARALQAATTVHLDAVDFRAEAGLGVEAVVEGRTIRVGRMPFVEGPAEDVHDPRTTLTINVDGAYAGRFFLEDALRPDSVEAVESLRKHGLRIVLLSGDAQGPVDKVALQLGLDEAQGRCSPQDKAAWIEARQAEGESWAMVGDGVNDAPAMAIADVGVAIGEGTDVAKETGDIVLVDGDLRRASKGIVTARATRRTIRQNLFWAFGYNTALVPLAMGILYPWTGWLVTPMMAAVAMAFSSVSVLGNSLRLRRQV